MDVSELSDKRSSLVKRFFTEIAPIYDGMNTLMSLGQDRRWRHKTVEMAGIRSGYRVLDVCTGTGEVAIEAGRIVGVTGSVTGLDFCRAMLDKAELKTNGCKLSDIIAFLQGDALALPFDSCCFDAVTVAFGIRNIDNILQGLKEINRVLAPGGRMACLELSRPSMIGFRELYQLYFDRLVPFIGRIRHGRSGPYDYLPESLRRFPIREELSDLMVQAGFADVRYCELMLGTVAIHTGVRM